MELSGTEITAAVTFITTPLCGAVVKLWLGLGEARSEIQKLNDRLLAEKDARRADQQAAVDAIGKLSAQLTAMAMQQNKGAQS